MTHKKLNRITAIFVFVVALITYWATMAPTVVFWDVGEFIAGAFMLQVPHPPGSPLFLLVTRLAVMIPFVSDVAMRAHAFSALCSAIAIMFLYLVVARVIIHFHGIPQTIVDKVTVYGGGVIGALSLAFSTTYWDNSIEAEVYGVSMLFVSAVMWLAMRWQERSEAEGNEKYIIFISYLIGLSLGVHLLALLTIFPVLMIIYFKRYEFSAGSFVKFAIVAGAVFFVVYPGIVKYLPDMLDGDFRGSHSTVVSYIPWLTIIAVAYGVRAAYKARRRTLFVALLSILLIFVGYTTYTTVLIRANVNPPMNENDPSNLARLTSYLGREQYGNAPLFMPRRYSQEPHQQGMYTNYTSEWDFLFRYQLNHMFFRYLGWNYIGSAGQYQDAGVDGKHTWAIPFLMGLLGLYYQFRKDWKMGLVFLSMFIIMGPLLALYQNQQEPQPRERDYFYVGAFYIFSLWVALGVVAIVDYIKQQVKNQKTVTYSSVGLVALFLVAIPGNLVRLNWSEKDRTGNYVAWDYSYNILQTCEKDAILFTNGDNDTFPLWYLQDVEGVRRDVRIVNLSLVNTSWYIKQMKQKPYYAEAEAVPISFTDAQIDRLQPRAWEPRAMTLPVPRGAFERYGVTDTSLVNKGSIGFTMPNTLQFGETKGIKVQDIMVQDIIFTNQWKRPIYFAVTVAPDSKIGLDDYLWYCGLAWRLEPHKVPNQLVGMNVDIVEDNLLHEPEEFSRTPMYGYKFRNIANPAVHFDENTTKLMINYRSAFMRLAEYYATVMDNSQKGVMTLDIMEQKIPRSKLPMGWELTYMVASYYNRFGQTDRYNAMVDEIEPTVRQLVDSGVSPQSPFGYNPYAVLLEIYENRKQYDKLVDVWKRIQALYPNDPGVKQRLAAAEEKLRSTMPDTTPITSDTIKRNQ